MKPQSFAEVGPAELIWQVDAPDNVWVCEMGTRSQWGTFEALVQAITHADIHCEGLQVHYESPSQGHVNFGWEGPLRVNEQTIPLHTYPRLDNPYCQCPFLSRQVVIHRDNKTLNLDFNRYNSSEL